MVVASSGRDSTEILWRREYTSIEANKYIGGNCCLPGSGKSGKRPDDSSHDVG